MRFLSRPLQGLIALDSDSWVASNAGFGMMMLGAAGCSSRLGVNRRLGWMALVLGIAVFIPYADFVALVVTAVDRRCQPDGVAPRAIDPLRPELLLYMPKGNGQLELVGVEYMRIAADQVPPIDTADQPSIFGRPFDGPMPEHVPGMGWHYDIHVWFWEDNPAGFFAPFNPARSCP